MSSPEYFSSTNIHSQLVTINSTVHPQDLFVAIFIQVGGGQLCLSHTLKHSVVSSYERWLAEVKTRGAAEPEKQEIRSDSTMFPSAERPVLRAALEAAPVRRRAGHIKPTEASGFTQVGERTGDWTA